MAAEKPGPSHNPSWKTMARLLRVIELLSARNGTNTQEIAREIGLGNERDVSRTILPALRELGLRIAEPDAGSPGISHRYWLERNAVKTVRIGIPKSEQILLEPILEPDELVLLSFLLSSGSRLAERPELGQVLQRLRGKLATVLAESSLKRQDGETAALFSRLEPLFEFLGPARRLYPEDIWERVVEPLVGAAASQRECRVVYFSHLADKLKTMDIQPLRLVEHDGALYMLSWAARHRNAVLPLEIGRFHSVEPTELAFELGDIDIDAILNSTFSIFIDDSRHYRIRFEPGAARLIRERQWAPGQKLEELPDGSLVLDMESSGYPDVLHWVLSWGAEAEVLEPPQLRRDVAKALRQALSLYPEIQD